MSSPARRQRRHRRRRGVAAALTERDTIVLHALSLFRLARTSDLVTYAFAGGTAAFLYPTPNAGSSRASQAFWQVADIEREVADLQARGVSFERYEGLAGEYSADGLILTGGGARAAWFKDSEGNILALIQPV